MVVWVGVVISKWVGTCYFQHAVSQSALPVVNMCYYAEVLDPVDGPVALPTSRKQHTHTESQIVYISSRMGTSVAIALANVLVLIL